ncbi:hypothetical protein SKAU_G00134450 [Synaphobranchus kaupii]|uniref:Reverse transcriptase/retrotransposon-derived protein RNase H-like domain-containing protein n=1 Tax=Synaphobranchus kaupii TaxID=118154 RepID=A0A9Q1FRA7_SYNKA|nr:hypothetical protein SKAU_G00134450 [Synaphobranchus kaupii]
MDYRRHNAVTHCDAYHLPRIEESLTGLKRAEWYSTLDLASGYWQVEVDPADLYHFNRMQGGGDGPGEDRSGLGVATARDGVSAPIKQLLVVTTARRKKTQPITWTEECQQVFEELKRALLTAPVLAFADFTLPFRLYTSLDGLGAALVQVQDGQERVIAYTSRSLHPPERNDQNYSSFKLELLALKWAMTDYLWGDQVTVFTDNNPLVHLDMARSGRCN